MRILYYTQRIPTPDRDVQYDREYLRGPTDMTWQIAFAWWSITKQWNIRN